MEPRILEPFIFLWSGLAVAIGIVLCFVSAPYGRHTRAGWGPMIPSRLAWVVMEAPSPILFALFFWWGERTSDIAAVVFLLMWELHYANRAFVFPFRLRGGQRNMPPLIVAQGMVFNCVNAWTCGRWLFSYGPPHPDWWLGDPRFVAGAALFVTGLFINLTSDGILRALRRPGEIGYRIPEGGLFRWVSSPNYLGEIIEWWGFAIATWSLAPVGFAIWTSANLIPRALANHAWYRRQFSDYPSRRRALIPTLF